MNFLAHFHLTPPLADALTGAFLGDFVRGPVHDHADLPLLMRQGIILHRKVDAYTDVHPHWRASASRLNPPHRRLAGVIIDVLYDHFLCVHWGRFATGSLAEFAAFCYASLLSRTPWMEVEPRRIVRRMKEQDWIKTYGQLEGIDLAFRRLSRRSPVLRDLPSVAPDLRLHYAAFEADFLSFYPELVQFAGLTWKEITRPALLSVPPAAFP